MTTTTATNSKGHKLLKAIPGVFISAFFLWYTFFPRPAIWRLPASKGISFQQILSLRLVHPAWILGIVGFTLTGYTLRCLRWTRMMRSTGARFPVCARVLMTSLAANNILPFRIGDIMRIFTYAPDLGASPSAILSTVILEKLLDVFTVGLLFVLTAGPDLPGKVRHGADAALAISSVGLLVLMFGARSLQAPARRLFAALPSSKLIEKIEHWLLLAVDTLAQMGVVGSILLLLQSIVIWACEGMIFVSAVHAIGLVTDMLGPWEAVSFANLSYMLPSSPGAIGPFEWAVKTSLVSHGAVASQAAVFGLAIHAWMLISITGAGGLIFLIHRLRANDHTPILAGTEHTPSELL